MTEIIDATLAGKIKALYIIGSDPASAIAPSEKVHAALKRAEFIVFQDLFLNETAKYAHVIFPAASFAEKEGTFINTEGKAQGIQRALEPAGNSRPDWTILCELAKRLQGKGFAFGSADEILSEIVSVIQSLPEKIGRFRLFPLQFVPPTETTDTDFPIILTTERDLYRGGFLSERVDGLRELRTKTCVRISPKDATDFEISDGESIRIFSRHGSLETVARVTRSTPSGLAVMDMDEEKINRLLNPVLDRISRTPEMKMCAIRLEKITKRRRLLKKRKVLTTVSASRHDNS
jgi:predicted molibdopterin-dependent oxidoreductase YjgC